LVYEIALAILSSSVQLLGSKQILLCDLVSTEIDGEAWLSNDPPKMETSEEEEKLMNGT
jgi:hypothetical protein